MTFDDLQNVLLKFKNILKRKKKNTWYGKANHIYYLAHRESTTKVIKLSTLKSNKVNKNLHYLIPG